MQNKLKKIKKEDIELYLEIWGYDGITFNGNSQLITALKNIWNTAPLKEPKGRILTITDQDENKILTSEYCSYGVMQLLYELEVFADIPNEVRNKIHTKDWHDFIVRFIKLHQENNWIVLFSKHMPLTKAICNIEQDNKLMLNELHDELLYSDKYMILQNGNGGNLNQIYENHKKNKQIETVRIIVLFRAFVMELLCDYFKVELHNRDVELFTVNWKWALDNPLYPKENIVSLDMEKRAKYSVSQIANNEQSYEDFLRDIYGTNYDLAYIREIMDIPNRLQIDTGNVTHEDRYGRFLNVTMGERKTAYQPDNFNHTIYLLGGCVFFGYAVEDSQTVASYLQKQLNETLPQKKWKVVNYATWGGDIDWTYKRLYQIPFKPGDIVLISYAGHMPLGTEWQENDVSTSLKQINVSQEFYFNGIVHCNHIGYEKVAKKIRKMFFDSFSAERQTGEEFYLEPPHQQNAIYNKQVHEYVESVSKQLPDLNCKNVGAIVMNCNPFTYGHQYLIEYAAKKVDILVIFVVEENKSYFDFEDRLKLVKQGTQHLDNVFVIPSGKMIISTVTFPGYFLKDTPEAVDLDTSLDVSIFGKYIAKAFNIQTRFVGEEPFDIVTRNYNESMQRLLPSYGIKLEIIPRKEMGGTAISASRVRKLLKNKDFSALEKLVPQTTYTFLLEHFQ